VDRSRDADYWRERADDARAYPTRTPWFEGDRTLSKIQWGVVAIELQGAMPLKPPSGSRRRRLWTKPKHKTN
jgi:hypothetical protein